MRYVGNKNFAGVIEFLINRLPKSEEYFSLFMGSGGLENSVYTSAVTFICAEKNPKCKKYSSSTAVLAYNDYKDLLEDYKGVMQRDFVFADPPYLFSSRRSGKRYYEFEFTHNDHLEFLGLMSNLKARVMITHPKNDLYDEHLKGWFCEEYEYMSRQGIQKDAVYMNYDYKKLELLNYNAMGSGFVERQGIKRQRKNVVNKWKRMPFHIREAIKLELKKEGLI